MLKLYILLHIECRRLVTNCQDLKPFLSNQKNFWLLKNQKG